MNLRDYLHIHEIDNKKFAECIGYSRQAMQNYLLHLSKCSQKLAKAVELYTDGAVSAKEMINWNEKGMEEKKRKDGTRITLPMKRFLAEEFAQHLCKDCNKKLTKLCGKTKKESTKD